MMKIILTLKRLVRKSYILTKLLYRYKLQKDIMNAQPIIIYQMGKVGSTSILHSIRSLNIFPVVYQVHTLSEKGILAMEKMYWGNTLPLIRKSLLPETEHLFISHFLKSQIANKSITGWRFITLVRDPIARNISEFFYSVDTTKNDPYLPDFYNRYLSGNLTTLELRDRFLERFGENTYEYSMPLNWFEDEFKNVLGIDIYSLEFPKLKGYQLIQSQSNEILILKLEMLKNYYHEVLCEFLEVPRFNLLTSNTASEKSYYTAYKNFISEVRLPLQYVSKVYNSKFARHFYSDQETNQLIAKWCKT